MTTKDIMGQRPEKKDKDGWTTVEQGVYNVPDIPVKDLLGAIPTHCFKRNAWRSMVYVVWDLAVIVGAWKAASIADTFINPETLNLPNPHLYTFLRTLNWALYTFIAGLFGTGIWVLGHECGHQAFAESKAANNFWGWVLHSSVGVPYYAWRITHAKHHASTCHMTQDQVFVPCTRSQMGLKPLNREGEELLGSRVSEVVKRELREALDDSPIATLLASMRYLLLGWPVYLIINASGQKRYPKGTNHFDPKAIMFAPHHYNQILLSNLGIFVWLGLIGASIAHWGFTTVLVVYLIPYLWVNHWLVLITFLQHTDPLLPHYRANEFTFARGALSTLDRNLLGDLGPIMGWLGAHATNGISETHVLHHVCSKIPHYHAWEASAALKKRIEGVGIPTDGGAGGWAEVYRVMKACKFVEDEGDVVFYKNANGIAQMRAALPSESASDSGIEVEN